MSGAAKVEGTRFAFKMFLTASRPLRSVICMLLESFGKCSPALPGTFTWSVLGGTAIVSRFGNYRFAAALEWWPSRAATDCLSRFVNASLSRG